MPDNPAGANAVAAIESHEEPLFKGSVSLWMGFRTFMLVGLLEVAAVAIMMYAVISAPPGLRNSLLIAGAALLLATNVMLIYVIARIKSNRYTITRKLIERESGLIVRHVDSLDLARVKDVELSQSLLERTLNIGTIELFSADRLNPDMRIEALPNPRPVYERLRDAVIALNQRRGIVTPEE